ncbi:MAG: glycosyltransferase family 2 protein [Candidatus Aminicenantes bacterium]|nr:glycosyltransferase family 2 protein [Candidatus Aminicenantes bacterium]
MPKATDQLLVSVIMATYNSARTLKLAIESVLAQDCSDYEVWIVGDACTDNSQQVVDAFADPRLNWINLAKNSGSQGAPNNEGIRRSRGEYIAYLGHDDLWFPWHLSSLLSCIERTEADLVHPFSAAFDPAGLRYTVGPPSSGRTYENHFVFPSCWLHRRSLIEACGPWGDPDKLARRVDMDFLRRVYLAGKPIQFYPRLNLLKFPSAWWGTYAAGFDPPQARYLAELKRDALNLEREVLYQATAVLAHQTLPRTPVRQALRQLLHCMFRRSIESLGTQHRLLERLRYFFVQRNIRKGRKRRGLPPARR